MHALWTQPEGYVSAEHKDSKVAALANVLEIVLALGFSVPVLVPLASLYCALQAVIVQHSPVPFKGEVFTIRNQLLFAICLGWALLSWLFYEAELHGFWLVFVGAPLTGVATLCETRTGWLSKHWNIIMRHGGVAGQQVKAPDLTASLLEGEVNEADICLTDVSYLS